MTELLNFSLDTENAEKNYLLAQWYEKQNHFAPAHTYYLRAAERSKDNILAYTALIRSSFCYKAQGCRDNTEKITLENALTLIPERPEAYYFLSLLYENRKDWQNSYIYASLGLNLYKDSTQFINRIPEYRGKAYMQFQKAIAAWWWGRGMESRRLFHDLLDNHWGELDQSHKNSVEANITSLGSGPESVAFVPYDKEMHSKLRYKFPWSSTIENNHSQVCQDLFILSMLDGKRNGTFVEIGGSYPFKGNNTALLEKQFAWTGVSVEYDQKFIHDYKANRSANLLHANALELDYKKVFRENFGESKVIDYLQLDIEPARNTYDCMLRIPFDEYKFAVITYEHDYYVDISRSYRQKSRDFLQSKGYILVVNDVSPEGTCNFEDWWVHPDLVNPETLNKMLSVKDGTHDIREYMFPNVEAKVTLDNMDWGPLDSDDPIVEESREYVKCEIEHKVYTKFFDVEPDDIVFDIGASAGPFTLSIIDKSPKEVHCFEPSRKLFKALQNNLHSHSNVFLNNYAIGVENINGTQLQSVFDLNDSYAQIDVDVIKFKTYIDKFNIQKINFLKIDCEGGEWATFTEENYSWITKNVRKISGEFHLFDETMKNNFIKFRDLYLKSAQNVVVFLSNRYAEVEDITNEIWNNDYIYQYLEYCNICFTYPENESPRYYSYLEVDRYVRENFFPNFNYKGVMVEVGAGPPEFISNSKHFRDSGWRTICVDPNPKFIAQHIEAGSEIYPYACANYEGVDTFVINTNSDGTYSEENDGVGYSALSIRYSGVPEHHKQLTIPVQVRRLDSILEAAKINKVDILSIDVEGWELEVLQGFDSDKYSPKVIIIENLEQSVKYEQYLNNIGYIKRVTLDGNEIYVKNEAPTPQPQIYNLTKSAPSAIIVDNFYQAPDSIRKFALRQEYVEGGFGRGFIGRRTEQQFLFPGLKERFEEILGRKITKWEDYGMNGRFQIAWSGEPLVYHCDEQRWGGMLYLTPDAPYQCGTTLYAHKQTRARTYYDEGWDVAWKDIPGDPHLDRTPWEPVDVLGNVYNRLVIFDASCIHSASEYFGTVKENSRLWQMFFFDSE